MTTWLFYLFRQNNSLLIMLLRVIKVCIKRQKIMFHVIYCNLTEFKSINFLLFLQDDLMESVYPPGYVGKQVTNYRTLAWQRQWLIKLHSHYNKSSAELSYSVADFENVQATQSFYNNKSYWLTLRYISRLWDIYLKIVVFPFVIYDGKLLGL